ncbi:MAG: 7-cyano-7-deazaguanine synthase [Gemmatimonadota bacterium]|nr:7-cyano-7-deazaguanine synthase [Gemmatimonadota bacterium]
MIRYLVRRDDNEPSRGAHILEAGDNLKTGESDVELSFGDVSSLEADLLLLASSIFSADRATARGEREDFQRNIELRIPVVNLAQLLPLVPDVEEILRLLSQDGWTINLRQAPGEAEKGTARGPTLGTTLLFSGGLDSLAAAVEYGRDTETLELVSHRTRNSATISTQNDLAALLTDRGFNVSHRHFFVSSTARGPSDLEHAVENTQRTRSFVFLVLGAIVARRTGNHNLVYLAENGQMAIHLPLTTARIGAFSTHTAHPDVLMAMERFLSVALSIPLRLINPYVLKTKREVVDVVQRHLPEAIPLASSCWRNAHLPAGTTHCGACIPCYVRRIAIEYSGPDATRYARDLWAEVIAELPSDDDGRRNFADLAEFIMRFETSTNEELVSEFPELISDSFDAFEVIEMYRRFAGEARAVLGRYPATAPFLS